MTYTPPSGVDASQQMQLGREGTAGTPVACTDVLRAPFAGLGPGDEIVQPEENIGFASPVLRPYTSHRMTNFEQAETVATYEQLLHLLEAGVKTVTGVQDGTGSDYIWTYPMPTNALNNIKTYTIKAGDGQQARIASYCIVQEFNLAGSAREAVNMSGTWFGQQLGNTTFDSPSILSVDPILFQNMKFYLDDSGGTVGTTQVINTLLGFNLTVSTGWVMQHTGDGSLDFSFAKLVKENVEVTLELTVEHNATMVAEQSKSESNAIRLARLEATGPAVATPGTTYSNKTFIFDMAGFWQPFPALETQDGDSVYNITLSGGYSTADALFAEFVLVNELSAVP